MSFFLSLTLSLVSRCLSILSFLSASFSPLSLFLYPYHSICLLLFLSSLFVSVFQSVFQCLCLFTVGYIDFLSEYLCSSCNFLYIYILKYFFAKRKLSENSLIILYFLKNKNNFFDYHISLSPTTLQ